MGGWSLLRLGGCGLVTLAVLGQTVPNGTSSLRSVDFTGGSTDDRSYALAAMGWRPGTPVVATDFESALEAIRATDRFKSVEGRLEQHSDGLVAQVTLDPWPELRDRDIHGELPGDLKRSLFPAMHKGGRAGDLRIRQWQAEAIQRLKEAGYPEASVQILRREGGRRVEILIEAGKASRIKDVVLEGDAAPYTRKQILSITGIEPGESLWTDALHLQALNELRQRLIKDDRLEGEVEFTWHGETGQLVLRFHAGPVVRIKREGDWSLLWKNIEDLLPFSRAVSYSPELLDEGDRRILRFLRSKGYLDAKVAHRREPTRGPANRPEEVTITFMVDPGEQIRLTGLRFEKNNDFTEEELQQAAGLPSGMWTLGDPPATPDLISAMEDRIKAFYWNRGYVDMALRRPPIERAGGKSVLVFQVREGVRQVIDRIVLDVPSDPSWKPWTLAETLPLVFAGAEDIKAADRDRQARTYRSSREGLEDVTGRLMVTEDPARPGIRTFTLTTDKPLPLVKNDLAVVFTALKQRLSALGVQRPSPRLVLERHGTDCTVRLEVTEQARVFVNRLVVQGADTTRAKAVLRETELEPGEPLDSEQAARAQANLGALGAFQRTDFETLKEDPQTRDGHGWQEGDLLLKVDERRPWVLSTSFGYDRSHGYHIGAGVQRQNFMGMGRVLDFGMRIGDQTLDNKALRDLFPTGTFNRSVDSFTLAYTDPWFMPSAFKNILQKRTQYRFEASHVKETQSAFLALRRRVVNTLDWKLGSYQTLRLGHRFERTNIQALMEGIEVSELFRMAGVPGAVTTISAPFFQFTRDTRDHPIDPTRGTYFFGKIEMANQLFGTGSEYSFVKLDVRHQWNWSLGPGVLTLGTRLGLASPTARSVDDLPLGERFFGGGPFTVRGVEPDFLGPVGTLGIYERQNGKTVRTGNRRIPLGGQGLVVVNLEYRFPIFGSETVWGEVFLDSGQVYARLNPGKRRKGDPAPFPALRTTAGIGLILKLGLPIKFEYALDLRQILGRPMTTLEKETAYRGILISAGHQF